MNKMNKKRNNTLGDPEPVSRPDLKILDCTIRDGGLMNSSRFTDAEVRAVYDCCADAGIDYMEIGFKNSKSMFSVNDYGPWRFCD